MPNIGSLIAFEGSSVIPTGIVAEVMELVPTVGNALFNMYPLNVIIGIVIIGLIVGLVGKGKRAIRK